MSESSHVIIISASYGSSSFKIASGKLFIPHAQKRHMAIFYEDMEVVHACSVLYKPRAEKLGISVKDYTLH